MVPFVYQNASVDFRRLLEDARDLAELVTLNQAYTMLEGVLLVFRRRLKVQSVLRFADVQPAVARAVFVARWDVDEPVQPFVERDLLTREVQESRADHNYAPDDSIRVVAAAIRRNVNEVEFDAAVEELGASAVDYWAAA